MPWNKIRIQNRSFLLSLISAIIIFFNAIPATGTFSSFDGLILDNRDTPSTADDLYFVRDLSQFTGMTYAEQLQAIANLSANYNGYSLAMATQEQVDALFADYPTFDHFPPTNMNYNGIFTWGRVDTPGVTNPTYPPTHLYMGIRYLYATSQNPEQWFWGAGVSDGMNDSLATTTVGAWVIATPKPTSTVPEPATMFLLSTGLIGLIVVRKMIRYDNETVL